MNVRELLQKHEGLKLAPYKCTEGKTTIGFGHNLDAHGEPVPKDGITLEQANTYLDADIAEATEGCKSILPNFDELDEVRQAVLIDMCFQMGVVGLAQFTRTLDWIKKGMFYQASIEMRDSKWARQTPKRAWELARMMETGKWTGE